VEAIRPLGQGPDAGSGQGGVIGSRKFMTLLEPGRQFFKLAGTQGALNVRDAIIIPQLHHFIKPAADSFPLGGCGRNAVVAENAHVPRQGGVIRQAHAAFAGGDVLDRMKAEHGDVRQGSGLTALVLCAERMTGVGDQGKAVFVRNGAQTVPVAGLARVIHAYDGLGSRRNGVLHRFRVYEQGSRLYIGENWRGALIEHAVGRGRKGHGRHDDFIARPDAQGMYGRMQSRRAVADRHAVPCAGEGADIRLEAFHRRAGGQPIGSQSLHDGGNVIVINDLAAIRQKSL